MSLRLATIEAFLAGRRLKTEKLLPVKSPRLHNDTHSLPKGKTMIEGTASPNISNELRILASFDRMNQTLDEIKNFLEGLNELAQRNEERQNTRDTEISDAIAEIKGAIKIVAPPPDAPAAPPPDAPAALPPDAPAAPPPDAPAAPPPDAPAAPPPDAPVAPRGRSPESY